MTTWFYTMFILVLFGFIFIFLGILVNFKYLISFWNANFTSARHGWRKVWRFLDTSATICHLIALIIGMASLFTDNYDLVLGN